MESGNSSTAYDEQQFITELYENYQYIMYATVRKHISADSIGDDLVQEAIMRLIPKASLLRQLSKPALTTYIVYTVRNVTLNYLRGQSAESNHVLYALFEDFEDDYATEGRHVESSVIQNDRISEFRAILKKLPKKQQDVLIRKYYLKQSDEEIARSLNCKASSVRMMLTRARRDAMAMLKKEGFTYEVL